VDTQRRLDTGRLSRSFEPVVLRRSLLSRSFEPLLKRAARNALLAAQNSPRAAQNALPAAQNAPPIAQNALFARQEDQWRSLRSRANRISPRYFFVRRNLDLDAMRDALSRMEGDHDFRNLAKMDTEHVSNFRRLIYETSLVETGTPGVNQQCYFQIKGQAFLWHMVRNIVAVLFFVGKKQELPSVVDELFDIEKVSEEGGAKGASGVWERYEYVASTLQQN